MKNKNTSFKQLVRYTKFVSRPFWRLLALLVLFVVLEAFFVNVLLPNTLENLVNYLEAGPSTSAMPKVIKALLCFFGFQLLVELLLRAQDYLLAIKTIPRLRQRIISTSVDRLLGKTYAFHERTQAGQLSENTMRLSSELAELIKMVFAKVVFFLTSCCCIIYTFFDRDVMLGFFSIGFFFFFGGAVVFFSRKLATLSMHWSRKRSGIAGCVVDILSNIFTIKIFASRKKEVERLDRELSKVTKHEKRLEKLYFCMFTSLGLACLLLQGISIYILWRKWKLDKIASGAVVAILVINENLISLLWNDLPDISLFPKIVGNAQQALELVADPTSIEDQQGKIPLQPTEGSICFKDVSFAFPSGDVFFDKLSLDIPARQKVGIVGYSGGGKSTLIKLLLRLYETSSGTITIDGKDISSVTQDSLRRAIGVVPQNISLFQRSLRENLQYGNENASGEAILAAAKEADVHGFVEAMEQGYDSLVEAKGGMLSGGQRQRLANARIILKDPTIILMDEATSQLDAVSEAYMEKVLISLMEGKTTLVIAHRLSTLLQMDRIIVLDRGKIVEDGTHEALLAQKGTYTRLWETQSGGFIVNQRKF